jgi:putative sterol carrier protein
MAEEFKNIIAKMMSRSEMGRFLEFVERLQFEATDFKLQWYIDGTKGEYEWGFGTLPNYDMRIAASSAIWLDFMSGKLIPIKAAAKMEIEAEGLDLLRLPWGAAKDAYREAMKEK